MYYHSEQTSCRREQATNFTVILSGRGGRLLLENIWNTYDLTQLKILRMFTSFNRTAYLEAWQGYNPVIFVICIQLLQVFEKKNLWDGCALMNKYNELSTSSVILNSSNQIVEAIVNSQIMCELLYAFFEKCKFFLCRSSGLKKVRKY